jgi:hypothetical protein
MRRDLPDFFYVEESHLAIHDRLLNWARYVQVRGSHWQAPIWKLGRSNGRQWHQPEIKDHINTLDGHVIEKAVGLLPDSHKQAIRWCYVWKSGPARIKRILGVSDDGLMRLVRDGRAMLKNRGS